MNRLEFFTKVIAEPLDKESIHLAPLAITFSDTFYKDDFPNEMMYKEAVSETLWNAAYEILHNGMAKTKQVVVFITIFDPDRLFEEQVVYEAVPEDLRVAIDTGVVENVEWELRGSTHEYCYKNFLG